MITLDQAKKLQRGDILIDTNNKRWKVSGMVQRWKTQPDRIRVPLKHGLYAYGDLTNNEFGNDNISHFYTLEGE